jgi:hypothetical protein
MRKGTERKYALRLRGSARYIQKWFAKSMEVRENTPRLQTAAAITRSLALMSEEMQQMVEVAEMDIEITAQGRILPRAWQDGDRTES